MTEKEREVRFNILKPDVDDREYLYFVLENGIRTVVVSDPDSESDSERCAASLCVGVGGFQDPPDVPGLAHFVEHMLFRGTEKYPKESDFGEFLKENGGSTSAYTSEMYTSFTFSVRKSSFEVGLDRFSSFFVCPLLSKDGVERELNTVHNEYEREMLYDGWKDASVLKSLVSPTDHPFGKFWCGNRETLQKENIHERVVDFFNECYFSNPMTLCLYGTESCEELKKMAIKYFSCVPNINKRFELKWYPGTVFHPPTMLHRIISFAPVGETRFLRLVFPIKLEKPNLDKKPQGSETALASHFLSQKTEGSFYFNMIKKGWVNQLEGSWGCYIKWNGMALYDCTLSITIDGENHIEDIIKHFFEYVAFVKSLKPEVVRRIYEERKTQAELMYRFKVKGYASQITDEICGSLFYKQPEYLLVPHAYFDFSETRFKRYLDDINVDNMVCLWSSPSHKSNESEQETEEEGEENENVDTAEKVDSNKEWKFEKWYRTKYKTELLPPKLVQEIRACSIPDHYSAPKPNTFLPKNLEVLKISEEEKLKNQYPRKVFTSGKNEKIQVYFKQDTQFKLPHSICNLLFYFSQNMETMKSQFCSVLLCEMINTSIKETMKVAVDAGFVCGVTGEHTGINIQLSGWSDPLKFWKLLGIVVNRMANFEEHFDVERFNVVKEELYRRYKNIGKERTLATTASAQEIAIIALHADLTHYNGYFAETIDALTFSELKEYYQKLFEQKLKVQVLCIANEKEEDTVKMIKDKIEVIPKLTKMEGMKDEDLCYQRVLKLLEPERGPWVIARKNKKSGDKNSCFVSYVEIGKRDDKLCSVGSILRHFISMDFYDQLRTKQQLGYEMTLRVVGVYNVLYFGFIVLSSDYDPVEISKRVKKFLEDYYVILEKKLTQEFLDSQIKVLMQSYTEKPKTLREEYNRYYVEIASHSLRFRRYEQMAQMLKDEKFEAKLLLDFYKKHLLGDKKELQVQVWPEKYIKDMKKLNLEAGIREDRYSEDVYFLRKNAKEYFDRSLI